jgi:ubiquinone/menaquinone biosynthesis C-methylase UbiE
MSGSRGETDFINLPGFAARLYDGMMQSRATRQQYKEIAQDLVSRIKTGRLLDIGTGPGYLLLEIHHLNPGIELNGLDISASMVRQAGKNLAGIKVHLKQGNISATDYPSDYFDLVTCSGSFYLWDRPIEGLEEIHRILKSGHSAYLYETHRNFDEVKIRQKLVENLKGENIIRRKLAPQFFLQQLGMTYDEDEIVEIIENTKFAHNYTIDEISIVNLPVWLRIELKKHAP